MPTTFSLKKAVKKLSVSDMSLTDCFRIKGRETVYMKVWDVTEKKALQLELETGRMFPLTASEVERVNVKISV